MTTNDKWKNDRDERLRNSGIGNDPPPKGDAHCIHCGRPFFTFESAGGPVGVCQDCIDD